MTDVQLKEKKKQWCINYMVKNWDGAYDSFTKEIIFDVESLERKMIDQELLHIQQNKIIGSSNYYLYASKRKSDGKITAVFTHENLRQQYIEKMQGIADQETVNIIVSEDQAIAILTEPVGQSESECIYE